MEGIHPKKAKRGLECLASEACKLHDLPPPTERDLSEAVARAHGPFELTRRLSLLEPTLGELIELIGVLDRALCLADCGFDVRVFRAFAASASDRNLCIVAQPESWSA